MPHRSRRGTAGLVFHVFNRAIEALVPFDSPSDYDLFLAIVADGAERYKMRVLAYVVMPNHWHIVLWPQDDASLSSFMHWVTCTHAKRWREARNTRGRGALYQGRFKAVAVQRDDHLLRVCRYVERNPLRARLVARAEDWSWSSASPLAHAGKRPLLTAWPIPKPPDWLALLEVPEPPDALREIREAMRRQLPYGRIVWQAVTIRKLKWPVPNGKPGRPRDPFYAYLNLTNP